jgi:hypothetical protein
MTDTQLQYLIAHISPPESKTNISYKNYNHEKTKEHCMIWDDPQNKLKKGDFLLFYCWGKRVEIHKIIDIKGSEERRKHWSEHNERNVICLSPLLHTYSFGEFALFDPPYKEYGKGAKNYIVRSLNGWPKLKDELLIIHNKYIVNDNSEIHDDDDVELAKIGVRIKELELKIAVKKLRNELPRLRNDALKILEDNIATQVEIIRIATEEIEQSKKRIYTIEHGEEDQRLLESEVKRRL